MLAERDFTGQTALLDAFLGPRVPAPDAQAERIAALIGEIAFERGLTRAATLAERTGQNLRALQRSFERYVGVGPKWVIRRLRIHDAAEQLKRGEALDFASLAQALGYVDQAHFIRDFSAQLGRTPTAYLAEQRARRADGGSP